MVLRPSSIHSLHFHSLRFHRLRLIGRLECGFRRNSRTGRHRAGCEFPGLVKDGIHENGVADGISSALASKGSVE